MLRLRADVVNQTGPLATQADNLAKYFRVLTCAALAEGPVRLCSLQHVLQCAALCGLCHVTTLPATPAARAAFSVLRSAHRSPLAPPALPLCRRLMESRFPVSHASGHARVEFAWFDAFRPQVSWSLPGWWLVLSS